MDLIWVKRSHRCVGQSRSWSLRQATATATAAAAACEFHCADVAVSLAKQAAMDLLGNQALLHAHRAEKLFRDVRLTQIFEGTNQINRLAVLEDLQVLYVPANEEICHG